MVHYIPFIHSLNLLSIHLIRSIHLSVIHSVILLFVHLHFSPFSYNTQLHCPNSFKCTLYLPHIDAYLYMYYICLFCQNYLGKFTFKPKKLSRESEVETFIALAGIPCFSVYLLSRRGNSQVAAIPGSLKLIHNTHSDHVSPILIMLHPF